MKIKRSYLYLADLNPKFGSESGKIRPVLVIQSDLLNEIPHPSTWVLPCTSKLTDENILRTRLSRGIAGNDKDCDVMIDQSRTIDNKRFLQELSKVPDIFMREIERKLILVSGIPYQTDLL